MWIRFKSSTLWQHKLFLAGDAEVVVAGGMENMSHAAYVLKGARNGFKMGDQKIVDTHDSRWIMVRNE